MQASILGQFNTANPSSPSNRAAGHQTPLETRQKSKEEYFAEWDTWAKTEHNGSVAANRMRAWLDQSQPDQPLILSGLRLRSLPDNLPANLRIINVSNNRLDSLPDNLPTNLHTIDASNNRLITLPENLPANLHTLNAHDNELNSLPENLPANLHTLVASSNYLTHLPANMPASLQNIDVGGNALTHLPETLPANLRTLDVSCCELESLPENLPESLYTIEVDDNQLTSLPANLPRTLTSIDARGNSLTSLPENILTLPNTCTIYIDASHLSEAVRNRLNAAMNAPGYDNVQIDFYLGNLNHVEVRPLQEEVSAWTQEAGHTDSTDWSEFQSEQHATQFSQFLGRLRQTSEYNNVNTQPNFQQRVGNLLQQLQGDPELRGACFNLADDAVNTCGDRVALRMLNMETVCLDKRMETDIKAGKFDHHPQAVVDYCKAEYRNQVLDDAASAKIRSLNFCDEIEVRLGYIVAFSQEFKLNAKMDTLLYGACSNIVPEDVLETRKKMTNHAFTKDTKEFYRPFFKNLQNSINRLNALPAYNKAPSDIAQDNHAFSHFLLNSPAMQSFLLRKYPQEASSLHEYIEQNTGKRQKEIYDQLDLLDTNDPAYREKCNLLMQQHNDAPKEVEAEMKHSLFQKFCSENHVRAVMD
ncbi:NEL-type E3 ubiquitin ligase domain-containing protein [Undibacterium sp. SXout7W]|uniref:NEL-type E3 ubiquitin ligase domain-containing protein n=1 Tax=Undibacterium sp. SXout7W TaxID=3413049 RepID=UPI003BF3D37B